jgi:hypothetical protein
VCTLAVHMVSEQVHLSVCADFFIISCDVNLHVAFVRATTFSLFHFLNFVSSSLHRSMKHNFC